MTVNINASLTQGLVLTSDTSGVVAFQSNNAETMRIDTSGNVGIGTNSPSSSGAGYPRVLDLSGSYPAYVLTSTTASKKYSIGVNSSPALVFYDETANAERMRIDTSGNLLVGTTSQLMPSAKSITLGDGTNRVEFKTDRIYFDAGIYYVLNTSNVGVKLTNGQTAWAAQSDEAVKDIIEPISDAANKVSSLRAVIGKYKKDEEGTRRSFLIAQDVQKVLPEAVSVDPNDDTLDLRYTEVIPLLVAAIKEQQSIISDLQSRIAALEAK